MSSIVSSLISRKATNRLELAKDPCLFNQVPPAERVF